MKVALIRPLCEGDGGEFQSPYGLECLQGYLALHGHEARVFDRRRLRCTVGEFVERVEAFGPGLVGLSAMTAEDMRDALPLIQRLRQDGRRFTLGGLFATTCPERARALCPRDVALVRGEGERALLALCEVREVDEAPLPVDEWPVACRDGLADDLARGAAASIRSARGCPGRCAFCATPGLCGSRFEARDVGLVADEMAVVLARYPEASFNFVDDDFGPLARVEALCAALSQRGCRAAFSAEMRGPALYMEPDLAERLRAVREGGLCRLFVGLESLDEGTLARWGKPMDMARLLAALGAVRAAEVRLHVGYMLWHADSTAASVRAEAMRLRGEGLFSPKLALSRLLLLPGSALHRESGGGGSRLQPLRAGMEPMYARVSEALGALYSEWAALSAGVPGAACRAWMTGDRSALNGLEARIDEINARAYEGFRHALG